MGTTLPGKHVGAAPRPRVALIGLQDNEKEALSNFFPTVHVTDRLHEIQNFASPVELDLIISANTKGHKIPNLEEYARCHLILLGPHAWQGNEAPPPRPDRIHTYKCDVTARSKQYAISEDLDPRLEAAMRVALPESALGLPTIRVEYGMQTVADPAMPHGWLAWALDPEFPLAVNVYREGYNTGLAWFPTRPDDCVALVKAICTLWAQKDRNAFPTIVEWADTREWITSEEQVVLTEQAGLLAEFADIRQRYSTSLEEINARFMAAKERADSGPRAILSTQDDALVNAVAGVLTDLGFEVTDVDSTRDPARPKREDLQLRQADEAAGWVAIVEVKGHKKRGANDDDLTKIERHVVNFLIEESRRPSLKIYVCNSQFSLPPDVRPVPYASSTGSVQEFCQDPTIPGVVVPTPDLFRLHRDRTKLGLAQARRLLIDMRGVFRYPAV